MAARLPRLLLASALAIAPLSALAQGITGSPSYQFLQAVKNDKATEVEAILAKPGTRIIDTRDPGTGEGALHIVTKRDDARYLAYLLGKGANPNIQDRNNDTPLLMAVDRGYVDLIPVLVSGKANVNLAGQGGQTPLIKAVLRRDAEMVRLLLEAGADPDKRDYQAGKSARDYAAEDQRNTALVKLFDDIKPKPKRGVSGPSL